MKRIVSIACAALCLVTASAAAQTKAFVSFGGGIIQPSGDFADVAKLGWHGLATLTVFPGTEPFGIQGTFFYGENKFDVGGGKTKLFGGLAEIRLDLRTDAQFTPYVAVGGGLVNTKVGSSSDNNGALAGGLGVSYLGPSRVGGFLEIRYVNVFDKGPDLTFFPLTVGLRVGI